MSWITGFADKAEQILNKIDQSAADTLQKKKPVKYVEEAVLSEVTTEPNSVKQSFLSGQRSRLTPPPSPVKKPSLNQVKSAPTMVNQAHEEEKLIDFLNDNSSSTSEAITDNSPMRNSEGDGLDGEKQMLKNEVRVLNNELSLLLHRTRAAEKESENLKAELQDVEKSRPSLNEEIKSLREQVKSLEQQKFALAGEKKQLEESASTQTARTEQILELQKQIKNLKEREETVTQRLETKERECLSMESARHRHQLEVDSLNQLISELRSELEHLRTRAQRTLSDKETLINQLRNNSDHSVETSYQTELTQLREEKQTLMDEHQETVGQLETVKRRLVEVEHTLDAVRESAARTQQDLQDRLAREAQKKNIIEDDFRIQTQELRLVREEYSAQRGQLTARLREREAELAQLRSQLSGAPRPPAPHVAPGELEVRLSSLTRTLIQKQTALESVTTERNQLRMQLEELEHKHREHLMMLHQSRIISANDTDDAKAQVPSFMMESPFDTGVARRVKRAYSSLDAVSIRTGVFLRRYPLARIMVILYVVLLHSLVLVVLCSRTPDDAQK